MKPLSDKNHKKKAAPIKTFALGQEVIYQMRFNKNLIHPCPAKITKIMDDGRYSIIYKINGKEKSLQTTHGTLRALSNLNQSKEPMCSQEPTP